jgi:hypothetical protein
VDAKSQQLRQLRDERAIVVEILNLSSLRLSKWQRDSDLDPSRPARIADGSDGGQWLGARTARCSDGRDAARDTRMVLGAHGGEAMLELGSKQ